MSGDMRRNVYRGRSGCHDDTLKTCKTLLKGALLVFLASLPGGCYANLCKNYDAQTISSYVHIGTTPKGGISAGIFHKDETAHDLPSCILSCCRQDNCNEAFFHQKVCFLIQCNQTVADACDPKPRSSPKFKDSCVVQVRSLEETAHLIPPSTPSAPSWLNLDHLQVKQECDPQTARAGKSDCAQNEECRVDVTESSIGFRCLCQNGYVRDTHSRKCIVSENRKTDQSCLLNLENQCELHEECTIHNSRSRMGVCQCEPGYVRDKTTGWCQAVQENQNTNRSSSEGADVKLPQKKSDGATVTNTTSTPVTTTPVPVKATTAGLVKLVVSAGDSKVIQLPNNEVTVSAYVIPKKGHYKYKWSLLSHPKSTDIGSMTGMNAATLTLSKLIAGLYTFKVAVSAPGKYGESFVNVTVLKPKRENKPPVAVIKPPSQTVHLPNSVILDGSDSKDDDKIVKYLWELVSGPLKEQKFTGSDKHMLELKDLTPGSYKFKLTVTDSDSVSNSTFANVVVVKEVNYPPKANAGSNVIISLPKNSVTLYGNASTDDKGIVSFEWIKKSDDKLTADMTGVRTPFLTLQNLEVGDYTFTLKVKDAGGLMSTADVHVFVKPEHNKPPVASAGNNQIVYLPDTTVTLDGRNSTDDQKITKYKWTQISGPTSLKIQNSDREVATAADLKKGTYKFKLEVNDAENLESSSIVSVEVRQNENHPPVANAGGDKVVQLPQAVVNVDGSKSLDDKGIVQYMWTRDRQSLAAGAIFNNSDHKAVLQLTDLVAGRYVFTLEVFDAEGLHSKDSTSIIVKPDIHENELVELHLQADIHTFTEANKISLVNQLELLLHWSNREGKSQISLQSLSQDLHTGHLIMTFYAMTVMKDLHEIQPALEVVAMLKKKLKAESDILDYKIVGVETLICQSNCSGHGHCDPYTKQCICEAFWMQNFVKLYLQRESNCDWSILYVIIVVFVIVIAIAGIVWAIMCAIRRCRRWKPKKRHRYMLLEDDDDKGDMEMKTKYKGMKNNNVVLTDSEFTSDEETLFVNNKKTNGHAQPLNGMIKPGKNKLMA